MTINEILHNKTLQIPIIATDDIKSLLEVKYQDYYKLLKEVALERNLGIIIEDNDISNSKLLGKSLIDSLDKYLHGFPSDAYSIFSNCMKKNESLIDFFTLSGINSGRTPVQSLFKLRESIEPNLQRKELFHVPLSKRKSIKSYRFSIPGIPSLYLGSSIYICWEELSRIPLTELHAAKFTLVEGESISLLNIGLSTEYIKELKDKGLAEGVVDNSKGSQILLSILKNFLLLWPLIASCHMRVKNPDLEFKPEYILPQLLMQFIMHNDKYDGIVYLSTKKYVHSIPLSYCRNIALPVKKQIPKNEYCESLCLKWKLTEPLPLNAFLATTKALMGVYEKDFAIIEGLDTKYSLTQFGQIEYELSKPNLKSKKI